MSPTRHRDVFCSYNSLDHGAVERIAQALGTRGLTVFLDRWELVPGRPWPDALEEHLGSCRSAMVVLGPSGMGPWQQREHYLALDRQARDSSFGVIPVILPNADPALGFLSLNTWVDLRSGVDDAESMDLLAAAIRGEPPSALLERTRQAAAQVCPYRGLEVFREEDAPFFFGRETFTGQLRDAVFSRSLVAVVGRSGSGKSSVVRAGLVPSLRRQDGASVWEVVTLVPGDRPLHALSNALMPLLDPELSERKRLVEIREMAEDFAQTRLELRDVVERVLEKQKGTDRLLLVVDQWEELYTHQAADGQAAAEHKAQVNRFIDALLAATEKAPLTLVLTLRADFYGEALLHRRLADALPAAQVNLGQMTAEELARAIKAPAEKVGLRFDPGLIDRLLDDVGEEPGNLPLMEFALKALWEARQGGRLLHDVYGAMGGVKGAIAERAESIYQGLDAEQRKIAETVFTLLVRPGEETGDTRRRSSLDELDDAGSALVRILAGPKARLLVTGRDSVTNRETVEVAHEALLREWPRLKEWIAARREALRLRDKVSDETRTWVHEGRPVARRWRHEQLDPARRLLTEAGLLAVMERDTDVADFLIPEAEWLLAELLCTDTDHARRETIGMRLSEIGDPRPGVGLRDDGVPDILWCELPGGEIAIEHHGRFQVPRFHLAAYPVTHAQFAAFLDAEDGFGVEEWWTDLQKEDPVDGRIRRHGNHPATHVSWWDATAFCRWLSHRLGFEVRLPDEWEWQWAAQSAQADFSYPWGRGWLDGGANTFESGVGRTTAVGMYPRGQSLQGICDLAGNVLEWCSNQYALAAKKQPSAATHSVLRGSSWRELQDNARADFFQIVDPGGRSDYSGFRVLRATRHDRDDRQRGSLRILRLGSVAPEPIR